MTRANDLAFARPASEFTQHGSIQEGNVAIPDAAGLTKFEYFAVKAMQGHLAAYAGLNVQPDYERVAFESVKAATALIKELNQSV